MDAGRCGDADAEPGACLLPLQFRGTALARLLSAGQLRGDPDDFEPRQSRAVPGGDVVGVAQGRKRPLPRDVRERCGVHPGRRRRDEDYALSKYTGCEVERVGAMRCQVDDRGDVARGQSQALAMAKGGVSGAPRGADDEGVGAHGNDAVGVFAQNQGDDHAARHSGARRGRRCSADGGVVFAFSGKSDACRIRDAAVEGEGVTIALGGGCGKGKGRGVVKRDEGARLVSTRPVRVDGEGGWMAAELQMTTGGKDSATGDCRYSDAWRQKLLDSSCTLRKLKADDMDAVMCLWQVCAYVALDVMNKGIKKKSKDWKAGKLWWVFRVPVVLDEVGAMRYSARTETTRTLTLLMETRVLAASVTDAVERMPPEERDGAWAWNVHSLLRSALGRRRRGEAVIRADGVEEDLERRALGMMSRLELCCWCDRAKPWAHGASSNLEGAEEFVCALGRAYHGPAPVGGWPARWSNAGDDDAGLRQWDVDERACRAMLRTLLLLTWPDGATGTLTYDVLRVAPCTREPTSAVHDNARVQCVRSGFQIKGLKSQREARAAYVALVREHLGPATTQTATGVVPTVTVSPVAKLDCRFSFDDLRDYPHERCHACSSLLGNLTSTCDHLHWAVCGGIEQDVDATSASVAAASVLEAPPLIRSAPPLKPSGPHSGGMYLRKKALAEPLRESGGTSSGFIL